MAANELNGRTNSGPRWFRPLTWLRTNRGLYCGVCDRNIWLYNLHANLRFHDRWYDPKAPTDGRDLGGGTLP